MTNEVKKSSDKVTIKIPRPLYGKIATVIDGAGYNSVTDFVVYVLRDLVASHEISGRAAAGPGELEKVKQHLQALGYI